MVSVVDSSDECSKVMAQRQFLLSSLKLMMYSGRLLNSEPWPLIVARLLPFAIFLECLLRPGAFKKGLCMSFISHHSLKLLNPCGISCTRLFTIGHHSMERLEVAENIASGYHVNLSKIFYTDLPEMCAVGFWISCQLLTYLTV